MSLQPQVGRCFSERSEMQDPVCTVHVLLWSPRNGAGAAEAPTPTSGKSPAPGRCLPLPRRCQTPRSVSRSLEEAFCKHLATTVNVQIGCSPECIWNKSSPHSTSFSFFKRCGKELVRAAQVNEWV